MTIQQTLCFGCRQSEDKKISKL